MEVDLVKPKEKDTREYLDDYYNTERAISARNLIRFTHYRHIRGNCLSNDVFFLNKKK